MTRKQRQRQHGGALEPTKVTPPFKYTEDPKRIASISQLYPYSSYFFSILKEIPWSNFVYEQEGYTAKCSDVPYIIVGGAAYEVYDTLFPENEPRVRDILDPSSDIDLRMSPLIITSSDPTKTGPYPFTTNTNTVSPIYNDYTRWLAAQFADKLKKISYNFPAWFGEIAKPTQDFLTLLKAQDRRVLYTEVIDIHPVYVTRSVMQGAVNVQVQFYNGEELDTFMECLFWTFSKINSPPSTVFASDYIPYDIRETILTPDKIHVNSFSYELSLQRDSIINRLPLLGYLYNQHKFLNHLYRTIYLLSHFEPILQTKTIKDPTRLEIERSIIYNLKEILVTLDKNSTTNEDNDVKERLITEVLPTLVQAICKYPGVLSIVTRFKENKVVLEKYGCNPKKRKSMAGGTRKTRSKRKNRS